MKRHACYRAGLWALVCSGLGVLLMFFCTDCLRPIAPEVLLPHLHRRSPDRTAVTFVALGDMGEGGDEQTRVAHAMYHVCQQDGCDFVLGLGDNMYPRAVRSVDDPQFQDKFERHYALFQQMDFWMILGNIKMALSCPQYSVLSLHLHDRREPSGLVARPGGIGQPSWQCGQPGGCLSRAWAGGRLGGLRSLHA